MIPEIKITCKEKEYFINSVTVEQYKKYITLMERNISEEFSEVMFFNKKIIQELFENQLSFSEVGQVEVISFLIAIKVIHFVMQTIVTEKLLTIIEPEPIEKEVSAFDEYDIENGYESEPVEENQWKVCGDIVNRVMKIAIRLLKNSYSQCMKEDIVLMLDYLKFELDTMNEN